MVKDIVEVKIIDANFNDISEEKFKIEIEKYRPDYMGISIHTSEYEKTLDIAAGISKEVNKNIVNIAGGAHVTANYLDVMKNKNIDYACRGEGEYLLENYCYF